MAKLEEQKERLLDLLLAGTIDKATYTARREEMEIELAVKRSEAHDAELESVDVGAVLDFANHLVLNARKMWEVETLDQRQRLQRLLFPEGLTYDGTGFAAAVTCCVFSYLRQGPAAGVSSGVAEGIRTPGLQSHSLAL